MAYKTISWTPKGEVAEKLWEHCSSPAANGLRYLISGGNPQDVIRSALYFYELMPKQQPNGCGDRSCWEVGKPIKVSLWEENWKAIKSTEESTPQELFEKAVTCYLCYISKTIPN